MRWVQVAAEACKHTILPDLEHKKSLLSTLRTLEYDFGMSALAPITDFESSNGFRLLGSQQFRQLGQVHSNAPCLIEGQHLCDVGLLACLSCVCSDLAFPMR
jgi:hypothetical protein